MDLPKVTTAETTASEVDSGEPGVSDSHSKPVFTRVLHSFKARAEENGEQATEGHTGDISRLKRKLRPRHIQMVAIGGCVGCGLFIGSGACLKAGGPGAILMAFSIIGVMIFCMVNAMAELATLFPIQGWPFACKWLISGSIAIYSTRFIDPAWGFAIGWNYVLCWTVCFPFELLCGAFVMGYWVPPQTVHPAVWITIFYLLILTINLIGVRGYGEGEYIFSLIKVIAVVGFIIMGIVIIAGGSPSHEIFGTKTWSDPGTSLVRYI
jgi:amino acid transporter